MCIYCQRDCDLIGFDPGHKSSGPDHNYDTIIYQSVLFINYLHMILTFFIVQLTHL